METATHTQSDPIPTRRPKRVFRFLIAAAIGIVLFFLHLWAIGALYFDVRWSWLRVPITIGYTLLMIGAWIVLRRRRQTALAVNLGGFVLVLAWWFSLQPSNTRDWQPDLAVLPYADINRNEVVIHNIRNCDYRSELDFDVHYYDKTFDLDHLQTADLYLVTWGSPHIAHTMVSFGFTNGDYVCFSIETRKEKGEGYSALKGLYRQFELTYIVADERDLVRLRTNYRQGEEACLYRLQVTPAQTRQLFLDYLHRVNELRDRPEWYNALTDNCTTAIRTQRASSDRAPWNWRMLVNGHLDELLYERGTIATNLPFAELKRVSNINTRAKAAGDSADFSRLIRTGLPGFSSE